MKEVYLQKENLNEDFFKDVLFFMFAEGGAMGTPGEIRLIKKDNVLYKANYIYGGFTWNEF